jgi:hypothetical protein
MRRLGISPTPRFCNIHRIDCMCHETILCHGANGAKSLLRS